MAETERVRIFPASQIQMTAFIDTEKDIDLKKAYQEMLAGCLKYHDQWEWYAMWMIELKNGTHIGDLCFKGLHSDGTAEIGYGILEEFQGRGYATEAVKAALEWAFHHPEVTAITAEADSGNSASVRVLEKCGFTATGETGEEGPRFILSRQAYDEQAGAAVDVGQ